MPAFSTHTRMVFGGRNRALPQYVSAVTISGFTVATGSHQDLLLYPDQPYKQLITNTPTGDPQVTIEFATAQIINSFGFINQDFWQNYLDLTIESSTNGSTWAQVATISLDNYRPPNQPVYENPNILLRFATESKKWWRFRLNEVTPSTWPVVKIGAIWMGFCFEFENPDNGRILRPREYQTRRVRAAGGAPYWSVNRTVRPQDLELSWSLMDQESYGILLDLLKDPRDVIACITPESCDLIAPIGAEHWFGRVSVVTPAAFNHPDAGAGNHFEQVTLIGHGVM